jgi:DNA-binding MarR family transcriptional regulator
MAERARMEEVLQAHGVTLHQYTALSLLERRDGLIHREPDAANRKILRASLTDAGRTTLTACHAAVDELERRMVAGFTSEQEREFRAALERSLQGLAETA